MKDAKILVVDDNKAVLMAVGMLLKPRCAKVFTLAEPARIPSLLQTEKPDVVLLDMNFHTGVNNGNEGLFYLREIKKNFGSTEVVLFTAYADIELAVTGIREGAFDFVVKPFSNEKLLESLQNAFLHKQGIVKSDEPGNASCLTAGSLFWGESEAMKRIRLVAHKVACTGATVLITGESGTGKGMLAAEIHRLSDRQNRPFVTVDMGAIAESLYESELFGHVKGAFTDARQDRAGKFEIADGGTLFLDEIGNLSYPLQAKLLTALQSKSVVRIGGNETVAVDVRFICATNRNLHESVAKGQFREDLLYRINTVELKLPPLRERKADIGCLAKLFAGRYAARYGRPEVSLSDKALAVLAAYAWPGNIRELEHVVERAVIMADGPVLEASDFELEEKRITLVDAASEDMSIEEMERMMIRRAIAKHNGNLSAVANTLGIARQTLYSKIKKYGL